MMTFPKYTAMSMKSSVRYDSYMVKQRIRNR